MSESKSDKVKPRPASMLSLTVFFLMKLVLIALLAFFLQWMWFTGDALWHGWSIALQKVHAITAYNDQFIATNPTRLSWAITQQLSIIKTHVQNITDLNTELWESLQKAIALWLGVGEIQLVRLFIFCLSLPFFILLALVFFIDGLVQRDIRKFQGARESAFIFHRLKGCVGFSFFAPLLSYLVVPLAISPLLFLVPQALLFSVITGASTSTFKKHL